MSTSIASKIKEHFQASNMNRTFKSTDFPKPHLRSSTFLNNNFLGHNIITILMRWRLRTFFGRRSGLHFFWQERKEKRLRNWICFES